MGTRNRIFVTLVLALAMVSLASGQGNVLLQGTADVSNITSAGKQTTILFYNQVGSANIMLEFKFTGGPATTSIPILGCGRGGTCNSLGTITTATNQLFFIGNVFDYIQMTPVFTGGASPYVTINYTSISQSSGGGSGIGSTNVQGAVPIGTALASAGNPVLLGCDSSNTGSVTAGQIQALKCDTGGILKLILNAGNGDTVSSAEGALMTGTATASPLQVAPKYFNGSTTSRPYVISLANAPTSQTTTARNQQGAAIVVSPPDWVINSQPAISTVASASIAAEAAVRHVMDQICFSAGAIAAPVATQLAINIRDGAAGAGTILQSFVITIPATAAQHITPTCVGPLNLVGTTNTAMTAEWSALLTNEFEQVSISGFNVQ